MRVLVTGAAGKVGPWVVSDLAAHGHEVVASDQSVVMLDEAGMPGAAETRVIDVTDVGQVASLLAGADAVVHLAAIAYPTGHAPEVVFRNNVLATFAVLQAATLTGVRRAVIASSLSVLGMAYAERPFAPRYVPVDEAHPALGEDAYALSKAVDEETAAMFARRTGMTIRAFRFPYVAVPGEMPRIARALDEQSTAAWMRSLWAYVDVRDAATACRLALEVDGAGAEVLNISAADSVSSEPTVELVRRYLPETELRAPIEGHGSTIATLKASAVLGYAPAHSWRGES